MSVETLVCENIARRDGRLLFTAMHRVLARMRDLSATTGRLLVVLALVLLGMGTAGQAWASSDQAPRSCAVTGHSYPIGLEPGRFVGSTEIWAVPGDTVTFTLAPTDTTPEGTSGTWHLDLFGPTDPSTWIASLPQSGDPVPLTTPLTYTYAGPGRAILRLAATVDTVTPSDGTAEMAFSLSCAGQPTVWVTKWLRPGDWAATVTDWWSSLQWDLGLFTLLVNGEPTTTSYNVGERGTTGPVAMAVGTQVTVAEVAGSGTDLNDYSSEIRCHQVGTGEELATGTTTASFAMPENGASCVVVNTVLNEPSPQAAPLCTQINSSFAFENPYSAQMYARPGDTLFLIFDAPFGTTGTWQLTGDALVPGSPPVPLNMPLRFTYTGTEPAVITYGYEITPDQPLDWLLVKRMCANQPLVKVTKAVIPIDDTSPFTLAISGGAAPVSGTVVNGGTVGPVAVAPTKAVTVTELAGPDTDLADYTAALSCIGPAGAMETNNGSFSMPAGDVNCTFTNERKPPVSVTLTKRVYNPDGGDVDKFTLRIEADGVQVAEKVDAINFGTTGAVIIKPGSTVRVSEIAGTNTDLSHYSSVLTCVNGGGVIETTADGSFTMPESNVGCTFVNTHKEAPPTVTLRKLLSPPGDEGKFILRIDGEVSTSTLDPVGNRGALEQIVVKPGTVVTVSELAAVGTATNLADYTSELSCIGVEGVTGTTSGSFTMPKGAVECTFTNVHKAAVPTLEVRKALSPEDDPGKFTLRYNLNPTLSSINIGHGGSTGVIPMTAGSSVRISEIAGLGTNLDDYNSVLTCTGISGVTGTTDGAFTMPDGPVVCTFTNTRKGAPTTVTVTKALSPASDTGKFTLRINEHSAGGLGDGGSTSLEVAPGTEVTVEELAEAGTSTRLEDYNSSLTCAGAYGLNFSTPTSGSFTMPEGSVNCTFTNSRKAPAAITPVPTLSELALLLLALAAGGMGVGRLRRRGG